MSVSEGGGNGLRAQLGQVRLADSAEASRAPQRAQADFGVGAHRHSDAPACVHQLLAATWTTWNPWSQSC